MLATASLAAPSCCLRCQLRQVLCRTPYFTPPPCLGLRKVVASRGFETSARRLQEVAAEERRTFLKTTTSDDKRKEIYRRTYPLGRIVGKPGRRQRERSETLRTPAMQKPFDVVVFEDVKIPEKSETSGSQSPRVDTTANAANKSGAVYMLNETATQEEVDASINELRPETHLLDECAYDELRDKLLKSYNRSQLLSYLARFQVSADPSRPKLTSARHITRSNWRPSQQSLGTMHASVQAQLKGTNNARKRKVAEEILRSAWKLSVESDESQIGELEMVTQRWQLHWLFALHRDNRPNYEHMIQSPLLLRQSQIEHITAGDAIRITARRAVAEEIASLLERQLQHIDHRILDLKSFIPMLNQPGWPQRLKDLLSDLNLKAVEQSTMCVIERGDDQTLLIYGLSHTARHTARRLLLSFLSLPSAGSITKMDLLGEHVGKVSTACVGELQPIRELNTANLPLRYRATQLLRVARPTVKSAREGAIHTGSISPEQRTAFKTKIVKELNRHHIATDVISTGEKSAGELDGSMNSQRIDGTYWTAMTDQLISPWEAQLCRILQPYAHVTRGRAARNAASSISKQDQRWDRSVVQSHVPGISTLLSYFSSREPAFAFDEPGPTAPVFIAHFFPSPFSGRGVEGMRKLHRLELRYDLVDQNPTEVSANSLTLRLSSMHATLFQEDLRVPLPEETADLRFVRRTSLKAKIDHVLRDREIQIFTQVLQQSLTDSTGALVGKPSIKVRLPSWLVADETEKGSPTNSHEDVEVDYMFERFEQIQTADLVPLRADEYDGMVDDHIRQVLQSMGQTTVLQYRAIEGGVIGGSRTELAVMNVEASDSEGDGHSKHAHLVKTSLDLVQWLTKINAGQVSPLQVSAGVKNVQ